MKSSPNSGKSIHCSRGVLGEDMSYKLYSLITQARRSDTIITAHICSLGG